MKKRIIAALLMVGLLCTTAHAARFTDVTEQDWYSAQVEYVYEQGLMSGTSATDFSPHMTLSRGMMLTILYRMAGEPAVSGTGFTDVEPGQWYSAAALWAGQTGIAEGSGDGTLGHADPLTREQMAVMLYRYAAHQGHDVRANTALDAFSDAGRVSAWAKDAMSWAVGNGLIQGAGGKLSPQGSADRAQTAVVIARFHQSWSRTEQEDVTIVTAKPGTLFYLADSTPEAVFNGDDLLRVVCGGKPAILRYVPGVVSTMTEGWFYRVETTVNGCVETVSAIAPVDVDYVTAGVLRVDGGYMTTADDCVIYAITPATGAVRVIKESDIADADTGMVAARNGYGYITVLYVLDADA